ncbi:unnamed protein product [Owenia fusiformis]|uniref:Uncharacterized protein n=1 Tax=Owenia fusiformis TaxID=6347 RepID=A0A8J1TNN7_OWEFU|nr:unnamed protein product [Owenia fusiformis]
MPPGFVYRVNGTSDSANVEVDFFIDLMCPDSKAAWPVLTTVAASYGSLLRLNVHSFPLPYHRVTWLSNKGSFLQPGVPPSNTPKSHTTVNWFCFKWIAKIFEVQEKFYNEPSFMKSDSEIIGELSQVAASLGVSADWVTRSLHSDDTLENNARVAWKYGCSRGVAGTPTFFVNGVFVDAASWDEGKWHSFIDELLKL